MVRADRVIFVREKTREDLKAMKKFPHETNDDIINRLISLARETEKKK